MSASNSASQSIGASSHLASRVAGLDPDRADLAHLGAGPDDLGSPGRIADGMAVPALAALLGQQALIVGFGVGVLGLRVAGPALLALVLTAWTLALLGGAARSALA